MPSICPSELDWPLGQETAVFHSVCILAFGVLGYSLEYQAKPPLLQVQVYTGDGHLFVGKALADGEQGAWLHHFHFILRNTHHVK